MNLEKLNQPISSESIEQHEQMLTDKIEEIKLQYVDRVFSKEIPPLEDKIDKGTEYEIDLPIDNFDYLLERYTSVLSELARSDITQKRNINMNLEPLLYDQLLEKYQNEITKFHHEDRSHWVERTMKLLSEKRKEVENLKQTGAINNNEDESLDLDERHGKAGLINYDVNDGYKYRFKDSEIPVDIENKDTCIEIHFDPLFKKSLKDTNINIFSSNSLGQLAIKIVDRFPETKAIIGESWLMDTPIAQRIGFKIYKREKYNKLPSFWSQFINSNGQVDNARVKQFLETGEAPYSVALGAIDTVEFLKKYLPKEYRGKIILREINPNIKEEWFESKKAVKSIFRGWDESNEEEIKKLINDNPIIKKFDSTTFGEHFIDFILEQKKNGKLASEISIDPRLVKYKSSFDLFINDIEFIDKEVIIE